MKIGKPVSMSALALAVVAVSGGTATAQDVSAEGAAAIELGLKQWIVEYLTFPDEAVTLTFDGAITAEPAGDRYLLTIPSPVLTDDSAEVVMDIGAITAELVPQGEHQFLVTWTVPEEWTIGAAGEQLTMTIADQVGEGLLDVRYETFLDFDMEWRDVAFVLSDVDARVDIGLLRGTGVSEDLGDGIYDIDADALVEDITFVDNESGDEAAFAGIGVTVVMQQLNMPAYAEFNTAINALVTDMETAEQTGADPRALMDRMAVLVEETPILLDAMEVVYDLGEVDVAVGGEVIEYDGGVFSVVADEMASGSGNVTIGFTQGALAIDPPPPFAEAIPDDVDIEMALTDLPYEAIVATMASTIRGMLDAGPEAALMAALFPLQEAAIEAGSRFSVNRLEVNNPNYEVTFDGYVAPSPSSPFGVVSEAELLIGQFAALRALAERLSPDPDALAGLAIMEAAGQQVGDDARLYTFEATEDGRVLLNGGDMGPLMQQMMR